MPCRHKICNFVFCLPGIWTADMQLFSLLCKSQIYIERSLHFSEAIPPMLFTYAMAVVLFDLIWMSIPPPISLVSPNC